MLSLGIPKDVPHQHTDIAPTQTSAKIVKELGASYQTREVLSSWTTFKCSSLINFLGDSRNPYLQAQNPQ